MNLIQKIESRFIKNQKIYIIPSKEGFLYIAINFTLFLIGLTYANNLTLLISFILFIFFLMTMFHTHQIMENLDDPLIQFQKGGAKNFRLKIHQLDPLVRVNYQNDQIKFKFKPTFQSDLFLSHELKRGHYDNGRFHFYTFGQYHLFYVWTYRSQTEEFYIYPNALSNKYELNSHQIELNPMGTEEFTQHTPYRQGVSSKRIDWKVFARTQALYAKEFSHDNPIGLKLDYFQFNDDHETRLSKLAYLIHKSKNENQKFELKLPDAFLALDKGESHRQKALEKLSVSKPR